VAVRPSTARLDGAAAQLEAAFPGLLRDKRDRHTDRASGAPRWQRERLKRHPRALARALRRIRQRQAPGGMTAASTRDRYATGAGSRGDG
jgi:hypothetical protein